MGGRFGNKRAIAHEEESHVIELYKLMGATAKVAKQYDVNAETIRRILVRNNVPRRKPKREKPREAGANNRHKNIDGEQVVELFEQGMTQTAIAVKLGCSNQTVHYHLKKIGLTSRRGTHSADIDAIEREYLDGATTYELGEKYGVSHETIGRWMLKRGHRRGKGCSAGRTATCPRCHEKFRATRPNQTYCSQACRNAAHWQCRDDEKRANADGPIEEITLREIYDRDRGRCYICGGRTDWNDYRIVNGFKVVGPRYPSRDHVIALHNGGTHTRENIRLACWSCNSLKSDKGQMRLPIAI